MSIENSPYIAGLNTNIPANNEPRAEGAAQIRGHKTAVKNSFPNVDAPVTATAARMNEVFNNPSQIPIGLIAMWTGTDTPEGWADSDGEIHNGFQTPDLRGMFVRGVDDANEVGSTGGNDNPVIGDHITIDEHKLGINEIPEHTHKYTDRYYAENKEHLTDKGATNVMDNDSGNQVGSGESDTDNSGMLFVEGTTEKTGGVSGHKHGISGVEDNPFDNRPAFYSIRYICYVGK